MVEGIYCFRKIAYFVLRELFILIIFALCYIIRNEKKKIMSVEIRLEQSKFKDKKGAGKWYARTVSTGVATTDDLADSIQENTSFSRGDVRGLVIALIDEISYRLRQGETIRDLIYKGYNKPSNVTTSKRCALLNSIS